MRRWIPILTFLVAISFALLAVPGSPVAAWLVDLLAGGKWDSLSNSHDRAPIANYSDRPALRAAVGAMVTPERTYSDYRDLFALVAERAGRRLELVQRKTYRETNDLISAGAVDMAWVCTGAISDFNEFGAVRLLAVPVIHGSSDYQSYIVVRGDARFSEFGEFKGSIFAFTDPLSLTGRRVVVDLLAQGGLSVDEFFRETFFTHAHDSSIRAVRDGLADGACVDSLVYDYLLEQASAEVEGTRVIWRSEFYPIPPLVTPSSIDNVLFTELQQILLGLRDDAAADVYLDHLRVDSFVEGDSAVYFSE